MKVIILKVTLVLSLSLFGALAMIQTSSAADAAVSARVKANAASPLNQAMKTLDGKDVNPAEKYAGKVVLLVNVASKCGLTPQYKELEALARKVCRPGAGDRRRAVQSVQRPGAGHGRGDRRRSARRTTASSSTCLSKVDVNGDERLPALQVAHLGRNESEVAGPIQWNFEKFLFNRKGELVARFSPRVTPDAPEVVEAIEAELATQ